MTSLNISESTSGVYVTMPDAQWVSKEEQQVPAVGKLSTSPKKGEWPDSFTRSQSSHGWFRGCCVTWWRVREEEKRRRVNHRGRTCSWRPRRHTIPPCFSSQQSRQSAPHHWLTLWLALAAAAYTHILYQRPCSRHINMNTCVGAQMYVLFEYINNLHIFIIFSWNYNLKRKCFILKSSYF